RGHDRTTKNDQQRFLAHFAPSFALRNFSPSRNPRTSNFLPSRSLILNHGVSFDDVLSTTFSTLHPKACQRGRSTSHHRKHGGQLSREYITITASTSLKTWLFSAFFAAILLNFDAFLSENGEINKQNNSKPAIMTSCPFIQAMIP
ncbi:MAG: hypothetical protein ACK5S6_02330, partial [bacterium]